MKRDTLVHGLKTAAWVMFAAAAALLIFTPVTLKTMLFDSQFWSTMSAAGIGGFLGSLLRKKSKAEKA